MFEAEARWLRRALEAYPPARLSPLLDLGSNDAEFRQTRQPWIEEQVFRPLRDRGVSILHVDCRAIAGVDIRADLTDPADLPPLRAVRPRALLCCNLLEHVPQPAIVARHCLDLLAAGGLAFVTVPFSYPYHRDPIDTLFRPSPAQLAALFDGALRRDATLLGAGVSYRDAIRERPWLLLRHLARLAVPLPAFARWRRSVAKLYWLAAEYRVSCAVFEKPHAAATDGDASLARAAAQLGGDSGGRISDNRGMQTGIRTAAAAAHRQASR